jgi:hypothetical protein
MKISTFIIYGIATAFTGFLVINGNNFNSNSQNNNPVTAQTNRLNFTKTEQINNSTLPTSNNTNTKENTPRRLAITVKVAEPNDLKIKEEEEIKKGQIIADRERERKRLTQQKQQIELSLKQLESQQITPPIAPTKLPLVSALPPISYLEHEANIEKTKGAISFIESQIEIKKQELDYLSQLEDIDPNIITHETSKLEQLKLSKEAAVRDYQLAMGKLQTAKDSRAYQEYQASLTEEKRVQEMNQSRLNYQRQLAEYEQRLADQEYRITQFKLNLNNMENALASLSTVKSPYGGKVRRIQWLGQAPDGSLTAEITLMVNNN